MAIAGLSPFQPAGVTSRIRRTLLQYEALIADEAWDEAIDLIELLQAEAGGELTKASANPSLEPIFEDSEAHQRYLPVRQLTQQLLVSLPPAGLEVYRDRIERTARKQVETGIDQLDAASLSQVADLYAASPACRDALLALSELALERGDSVAARRALQRIDRLAWDPLVRPAGVTLGALDPDADPIQVAAVWTDSLRPEGLSVLPVNESEDSLTPLVLSRLALVSLREGDLRRAAAETRLLRGIAPQAVGRLAGREQPLADALEALLAEQRTTTPKSPVSPYNDFTWAWPSAVALQPQPTRRANLQSGVIQINGNLFAQPRRLFAPGFGPSPITSIPSIRPVASSELAFYVEQGKLKQLDLSTGETSNFKLPGVEENPVAAQPAEPRGAGQIAARRFVIGGARGQVIQFGRPAAVVQTPRSVSITRVAPTLAVEKDRLYVRTTKTTQQPGNRRHLPTREEALLGIDLKDKDSIALRLTIEADEQAVGSGYQFSGPPTVRGERLYVALSRPGTRTEVAVACYSTHSARELWRTTLGMGEPTNRLSGGPSLPITLVGDTLYLATEMGAVTALDPKSGAIRWIAQYPRDRALSAVSRSQPTTPSALPCVVVDDRLIAAPADSTKLLAWDAGTGRPLWESPRPSDAQIAGVSDRPDGAVVVLSGRQIASYDSLTGTQRFAWPESDRSGLRGIGRAAVVGGEVYWPTRDALYSFDSATGAQTRPPVDLTTVGGAGANVIPTDYGLLIVGPQRIRLLAALNSADKPEPEATLSRLIGMSREPLTLRLGAPRDPSTLAPRP